jgi:putative hydrolase of the HAD superfamily
MMPADIRAVVFDAVGTLLHPDPPAAVVYAEAGRRMGSRYSAADIVDRFADAFGREDDVDVKAKWRTSDARELRRWVNIVARVVDDVSDPVRCFEQLYQHFAEPGSWRCEADAAWVTGQLSGRGLRLALASNYDQRLRSVVAGFPELAPLELVISSEVGWRKPAPQFFEAMCQAVKASPDKVLYVGDDVTNDYEGARAAGVHAVLFDPHGRHAGAPIATCARLRDLLN